MVCRLPRVVKVSSAAKVCPSARALIKAPLTVPEKVPAA